MKNYRAYFKFVLIILIGLLVSCKGDDDVDPNNDPNNPNAYVNNWIKENMDFWYYWNDEIPSTTDKKLAPDQYFGSLLSNKDKFSWIQDNFEELLASLQGVSTDPGYEIRYLIDADSTNLIFGQILYVKENSPAATAGLRRGDLITHVNGTRINTTNYQAANRSLREPHTFRYRRYDYEGDNITNSATINLTPITLAENPNFLDTIYQIKDKKIGYYVYNQFSSGPTSASKVYQTEMDEIFQKFRAANINELILDLRYNSGGSLDVSINLASLLAKGATPLDVFTKRKYNPTVEDAIRKSADLGPGFLENKFVSKNQNVGNLIPKLYVLTGSRTASASEVLINGIKPFTQVFIIGDTTVGKNQGSISLYEKNDAKNKWGMQPIVVFIANGRGESDFGDGFFPNVPNRDVSRKLFPLGDMRENLLSKAIGEITGVFPARVLPSEETGQHNIAIDLWKDARPVQMDDAQTRRIIEKLKP